jgi:hypothetical protein
MMSRPSTQILAAGDGEHRVPRPEDAWALDGEYGG